MQTAWIDARNPMANQRLWGLTLLERNLRELHRLEFREVTVVTAEEDDPIKHFCHVLPKSLKVSLVYDKSSSFQNLLDKLAKTDDFILALEGHALNDRRILKRILEVKSAGAVISPTGSNRAGVALLSSSEISLFENPSEKGLTFILSQAVQSSKIRSFSLSSFEPYIENLRREIAPYLLQIETPEQLKEADQLLRKTAHKGVLEFVAMYLYPPLEFVTTRLIAHTKITPNLITVIWLILSAIAIPLFATGNLLLGIILAAISGVLDGIDGKLARLTLRFSKTGDLLDHVGGTIYDAIWYLALGWYFANGNLNSTAAYFTYVLFGAYVVQRAVPGLFKKLHGSEIYDYAPIDTFVRLIGCRMSNNVLLMLVGIILGLARETFYFLSIWMVATAIWSTLRLLQVTWKSRTKEIHSDQY